MAKAPRIHASACSHVHKFHIHRFMGAQVHGSTAARVDRHRSTGARVHRCTGSQVHGFTGARVHRCTGSLVHRLLVHRFTTGCTITKALIADSQQHRPLSSIGHSSRASGVGTFGPCHFCSDSDLYGIWLWASHSVSLYSNSNPTLCLIRSTSGPYPLSRSRHSSRCARSVEGFTCMQADGSA
jgi:hypothetical protein